MCGAKWSARPVDFSFIRSLSGRLDEATHFGRFGQRLEGQLHAGHAFEVAHATRPDPPLALLEQARGHFALQFAEHDLVHVASRDADEALQQLIRAGAAAERTEQLGIDGVLQQLAVDQRLRRNRR